jgi:signal transduction histidine kinase
MHDYFRYDFAVEIKHGLNLLTYKRSALDMVHEASNHLVSLLGFFILIGAWHSTNGIQHKQITLLGISFIIPLSVNILFIFGLIPAIGINPTPFVLLPGSFLQAWVVLHSRILNITPTAWPLVFDHIGAGILVLDKDGHITGINPAAQALIGATEPEALGHTTEDLPSPWNKALNTTADKGNLVHLPNNQISHWLHIERINIGTNQTTRGTLVLLQDATSEVLNQQKAELTRKFEDQQKQLWLQKRFLRDIHDGLGGLASNLSLMSVLAEKEEDPKSKDIWLSKIEQTATEINLEIRNLMSALESTSMNWDELISSIRHTANLLFNPDITTVNVHIGDMPAKDTVGFVEGLSLSLMVRECMSNIVKHAKASKVDIDLSISAGHIKICISDNGCGFNPETVKRGRGLNNLAKRTRELGGSLETTSENGTRQTLIIPTPLRVHTE